MNDTQTLPRLLDIACQRRAFFDSKRSCMSNLFAAALAILLAWNATSAAEPVGSDPAWYVIEDCPVLVEHAVDIPAWESGVVESIHVQLNDSVTSGKLLAQLDSQLAAMEVKMAQLQLEAAVNLAEDKSDIDYRQLELQEFQDELASTQRISSSVSDSEIRRLNLTVGKARVAMVRAGQAQARAVLEAELQRAAVAAAEKRLERRKILSPIDGVISAVFMHAGQWIEAGQPIARIENMNFLIADSLVAIAEVDPAEIVGAKVQAEVHSPQGPVRLTGQVLSYDHQVSRQGFIRVHSRITNVQQRGRWLLLPGMTADLRIPRSTTDLPQPGETKAAVMRSAATGNPPVLSHLPKRSQGTEF